MHLQLQDFPLEPLSTQVCPIFFNVAFMYCVAPAAVRDALLQANIVPIFVVPTNLASNYQTLVNSWGFGYVRGISAVSAANIFSGVMETVNILSTSIKAISLPSLSNVSFM